MVGVGPLSERDLANDNGQQITIVGIPRGVNGVGEGGGSCGREGTTTQDAGLADARRQQRD